MHSTGQSLHTLTGKYSDGKTRILCICILNKNKCVRHFIILGIEVQQTQFQNHKVETDKRDVVISCYLEFQHQLVRCFFVLLISN